MQLNKSQRAGIATLVSLLAAIVPATKVKGSKVKPTKRKATATPKVKAAVTRDVPASFKVAGAYKAGTDCPFCGSKAAGVEAHPKRDGVVRQLFSDCRHKINLRNAQ